MLTLKKGVIFVNDYFFPEYTGGAEMTLDALMETCPGPICKIKSEKVNVLTVISNMDKLWVFGNASKLNKKLLPMIAKHLKYVTIEFDYRYCQYRSEDIHKESTGKDCDCRDKRIIEFLDRARKIYFMSERQRDITFKALGINKDNVILSSVFNRDTLELIEKLAQEPNLSIREYWLIVYYDSWLKGSKQAVELAVKKSYKYRTVDNIPYADLLRLLKRSKGLVYTPNGGDTCPRLVIEAKLLGCLLELNDNVQHKDEAWFNQDRAGMVKYLGGRPAEFWNTIGDVITNINTGGR